MQPENAGIGASDSLNIDASNHPIRPQRPHGNIRQWPGNGDVEQAGGWWVSDYGLHRDLVAGRSDLFDQ